MFLLGAFAHFFVGANLSEKCKILFSSCQLNQNDLSGQKNKQNLSAAGKHKILACVSNTGCEKKNPRHAYLRRNKTTWVWCSLLVFDHGLVCTHWNSCCISVIYLYCETRKGHWHSMFFASPASVFLPSALHKLIFSLAALYSPPSLPFLQWFLLPVNECHCLPRR